MPQEGKELKNKQMINSAVPIEKKECMARK